MPPDYRINIVGAIGSMTSAIHAQRVLQANGIRAEVVALLPSETKKGCAYGIEFPEQSECAARAALRQARVRVSQFLRKEPDP